MPIKFSELPIKGITETSKVIGLYTDSSSPSGVGNCVINVNDFAKQSKLLEVDASAVHIYDTEIIQGDKTFTGKSVFNNTTTISSSLSVTGNASFSNVVTGTIQKAQSDANGRNIVNTYATKAELNEKPVFNLFHNDWFDYTLNDQSWSKSDTFSWLSSTAYSSAYNHLVADISGKTAKTEKIYKSSNISPVGNIENCKGVISSFFEKTAYATHAVKKPTSSFEYVIKCKQSALTVSSSMAEAYSSAKGIVLRVVNASTGQVNIWVGTGSAWRINNVNTNCPMRADTWMWYKMAWNGSTLTVSYSTDGTNYTQGLSTALTEIVDWSSGYQNLGGGSWEQYPFTKGCIDLNGCYLKIDGSTYWSGCTYNTLTYYEASDGHKIATAASETAISDMFNSGESTWYYILDTTNKRFKLPRVRSREVVSSYNDGNTWYRLYADGWVEQGGMIPNLLSSWKASTTIFLPIKMASTSYYITWTNGYSGYIDHETTIVSRKTTSFDVSQFVTYQERSSWEVRGYSNTTIPVGKRKYLYFYIGSYTQTATAQTAGLNAELFNNKMDRDLNNMAAGYDFVIDYKVPTASDPTWYRKYKSGWVEQGGVGTSQQYNVTNRNVTFLINMKDTSYACNVIPGESTQQSWDFGVRIAIKYTDGIDVRGGTNSNSAYSGQFHWEVKGMSA